MASNENWVELTEALTEFNSTLGQVIADNSSTGGSSMALGGGSNSGSYHLINTTGTGSPGYNPNWQTSPSIQVTPGFSPTYFDQNICPLGHVASEDDIEFVDGVIISKCITCGSRMQVNRVAGGMSLLRVQTLLGKVMSMDGDTEKMEEFNLSEVLGDFAELKERLETEEFALRQARKLIELASEVLTAKVTDE